MIFSSANVYLPGLCDVIGNRSHQRVSEGAEAGSIKTGSDPMRRILPSQAKHRGDLDQCADSNPPAPIATQHRGSPVHSSGRRLSRIGHASMLDTAHPLALVAE